MQILEWRSTKDPLLQAEPEEVILSAHLCLSRVIPGRGSFPVRPPNTLFVSCAESTHYKDRNGKNEWRGVYVEVPLEVLSMARRYLFGDHEEISFSLTRQFDGGVKLFAKRFNSQCLCFWPCVAESNQQSYGSLRALGIEPVMYDA